MSPSKKVWVIEAEPPARKTRSASAVRSVGSVSSKDRSPASRVRAVGGQVRRVSGSPSDSSNPSAWHVVAAYALGSAAPFIVQQHPRGGIWAAVAVVAFAIWSFVVSQWNLVQAAFTHGWLPFHVWLVAMSLISVVGITSWSRAILLVGREFSGRVPQSNCWWRGSVMIGLLGLVVPGLGLMLMGRRQRAAVASWISGFMILSVLVLWHAKELWEAHQQSASAGIGSLELERLLLACMLTALLGTLAWIINAYDGARLANRIPLRASMQGPWWAVALLLSAVAFFLTFDPGQQAQDLDDIATSMHEAGFQYIPLQVQLASLRLDPSNIAYRMQVVELYQEMGKEVDAAMMRDDVLRRWDADSARLQQARQVERTTGEQLPANRVSDDRPVRFLVPIQP